MHDCRIVGKRSAVVDAVDSVENLDISRTAGLTRIQTDIGSARYRLCCIAAEKSDKYFDKRIYH